MNRSRSCALRGRSLLFASAALTCALLGCQSKSGDAPPTASASVPAPAAPDAAQKAPTEAEAKRATPGAVQSYGEALSQGQALALGQLLAAPEDHAGKTVLVEGVVRRACSRRGCWLELATSDGPEGQRCRVTFKDYGFFVPTDSAGAKARIEGTVELTQVTPSHVQHPEEEGATFTDKQADGAAIELRLVATGVELSRG